MANMFLDALGILPNTGAAFQQGWQDAEQARMANAARQAQIDEIRSRVEEARAARERRAAFQNAMENTDPSDARAIARVMGEFPEYVEQIKSTHTVADEGARKADQMYLGKLYGLMRGGNYEGAFALARDRYDADAKAGKADEGDTAFIQAMEQAVTTRDPAALRAVQTQVAAFLAAQDPAKFAETFGGTQDDEREADLHPSALKKAEADATKAAVDAEYADEQILADLANIDSQIERRRHETAIGYGNLDVSRGNLGVAQNRLELDRAKATQAGTGKEPSESERTAGFLASRLAGALQDITGATKADPKAALPGRLETVASGLGLPEALRNKARSDDRQRVVAAQLDALDAALTLGTGAAYNREQLEGYRTAYFPAWGDSPETVKEKTQRFIRLLEAAKVKAGRAAPPQIDEAIKAARGGLRADREGAKELPKGAVMVGTSGGQPVYQLPDGRKVKWSD